MIKLGPETCTDLETACGREWLETNGLGGFASSTVLGLNTRRYHGLLTAALRPPAGRLLLLSKLEESVWVDGRKFDLSANRYAGAVYPEGYRHLTGFQLDPFPVFTYTLDGVEIRKSVFMVHGENTTVVQYQVARPEGSTAPVRMEVRALIGFRDYHATTHENGALNPYVHAETGLAWVRPYEGLPELFLAHEADGVDTAGYWYRGFELAAERERGLDCREDLFSPFCLHFSLDCRDEVSLIASTERREASDAGALREAEIARRQALVEKAPPGNELVSTLLLAADQFLVERGDQKTIIAGYPWFMDWGRDTMIALPGLTLATGRPEITRQVLLEYARHMDRGMLPNRFPDAGEQPDYNTVDATLWYFEAARAYLQYTGDEDFLRTHLYEALADSIAWHERGTRYGIRVDTDGLLCAGEEGTQLTWMDAKVGDWVVTPRRGKPVEIQALWYNALHVMHDLARRFGDAAGEERYARLAARARRSFTPRFWNEELGCLYDVVDDTPDDAVRPNQILAVSIHHGMLSRTRAKSVVEVVQRELLTPVGLRSLAPGHPDYQGRYGGDPRSRDGAYHQGTVWAWLMGPFLTAYVKAHGGTRLARQQAGQWLAGFRQHLPEAGVGQVSEIFDGDPPHTARGCIAQAWSVAELLRAGAEDALWPAELPINGG